MKVLIPIVIGLLVVGCGKAKQPNAEKPTPATNTNKGNGAAAKPVKELAKEDVVGTYELKGDGGTNRAVLLDNGIWENYENGKKTGEYKWKLVNGEIHFVDNDGDIIVLRINKDRSIIIIAKIDKDGERINYKKDGAAKKLK